MLEVIDDYPNRVIGGFLLRTSAPKGTKSNIMKITLDRPALLALIDSDPQFELDLKSNVISEVARKFFDKDIKRIISAAEPELFAKVLKAYQNDADMAARVQRMLDAALTVRPDSFWSSTKTLSKEAVNLLAARVAEAKAAAMLDAGNSIEAAYRDKIKTAVETALNSDTIDARIQARVDQLVEKEIQTRAEARFEARMKDIRGMLT